MNLNLLGNLWKKAHTISSYSEFHFLSCIPQVENYAEAPDPPASLEFLQLAQLIMGANCLQMPRSIEQAIDLYVALIA